MADNDKRQLRDWSTKSYDTDGRAVSSTSDCKPDPQVPRGGAEQAAQSGSNKGAK